VRITLKEGHEVHGTRYHTLPVTDAQVMADGIRAKRRARGET
jgi:hypothetical protein